MDVTSPEYVESIIPLPRTELSQEKWDAKIKLLEEYAKEYGTVNVPTTHNGLYKSLRGFLECARLSRHKLPPERVQQLLDMGFLFDGANEEAFRLRWEAKFEELMEYKRVHGHTRVNEKDDKKLFYWCKNQRADRREGRMSSYRRNKLDEIEFDWTSRGPGGKPLDARWEQRLQDMVRFYEENGHWWPSPSRNETKSLAGWAKRQRQYYATIIPKTGKRKLRKDRIERLESAGFPWTKEVDYDQRWENKYNLYLEQRKSGNWSQVVWTWATIQRARKENGTLEPERLDKLQKAKFEWSIAVSLHANSEKEQRWHDMYQQLVKFYQENGHCNVPKSTGQLRRCFDTQLGAWRADRMRKDRKDLLDKLNFPFRPALADIAATTNPAAAPAAGGMNNAMAGGMLPMQGNDIVHRTCQLFPNNANIVESALQGQDIQQILLTQLPVPGCVYQIPLHICLAQPSVSLDVIRLLISLAPAAISMRDVNGQTALQVAQQYQSQNVALLALLWTTHQQAQARR